MECWSSRDAELPFEKQFRRRFVGVGHGSVEVRQQVDVELRGRGLLQEVLGPLDRALCKAVALPVVAGGDPVDDLVGLAEGEPFF